MDFCNDGCEPNWEPWKFNLDYRDFNDIRIEFNTVPSAIQEYGSFCEDFEGIASYSPLKSIFC